VLYKYLKEKELQFNISKVEEFPPGIRSNKGSSIKYIIQFESAFKTAGLNDFHSTRILRRDAVLKIIFDFIEK